MAGQIDHEKFIVLLNERFPPVACEIDECARGLLHLEMSYLARATQSAISDEDTAAVKEYFGFIGEVYRMATLEVKNAIHVSYLECLSFDGRHGKRIKARELLSPQLQAGLRGLEEYNAALFAPENANRREYPMLRFVFRGNVVLPADLLPQGVVVVENEWIVAVGPEHDVKLPAGAEVIDARDGYISPGFVDIHTHGGAGSDYMDGTPEAVRIANRAHARHGTTTIFPTTTTGTRAQLTAMLDAVEQVARNWKVEDGARIAGVHWYGPYFATEKVGAHPKGFERNPDPAEYEPALARGIIKSATCAAELPGAVEFCRSAKAAGCLVTCGHSNASWPEMAAVYAVGMRHVDHFWNAMSSTDSIRKRLATPQRGSMAEFVLYHPEMSTEVIADGFHHAPEMLQFAYRLKGPARLCLVSDCSRALDTPPGIYRIGHHQTGEPFHNNGTVGVLPGTATLASSIFPLEHMVRVMTRDTDAGLAQVIRMASLTPAERTGLAQDRGSLEPGKLADIAILSRDLYAKRTFINGIEFAGLA